MAEYIDREALIERIRTDIAPFNVAMVFRHIHNIPAADVAPVVHAQWEDVFQDGACSWSGRCSACKVRNDIPHPLLAHYCPNCGAKMDGGENS